MLVGWSLVCECVYVSVRGKERRWEGQQRLHAKDSFNVSTHNFVFQWPRNMTIQRRLRDGTPAQRRVRLHVDAVGLAELEHRGLCEVSSRHIFCLSVQLTSYR